MARFAVDTDDDHSAPAWIATLLCFSYSWLAFFARAYVKLDFLGNEDWILLAAQAVASGQFGSSVFAIQKGIASRSADVVAAEAFKASQVLYILAVALSKLSMILLISRIFRSLESRRAANWCSFLGAAVAFWALGSVLATSLDCNYNSIAPTVADGKCPGIKTRWLVVLVFDAVTDLGIALLPVKFCYRLQMRKNRKAKVISAFALRLICIFFGAMFVAEYPQSFSSGGQQGRLALVLIWQQTNLAYALIAATIPVGLQFIEGFTTGTSAAISVRERSAGAFLWYGGSSSVGKTKRSNSGMPDDYASLSAKPHRVGNSTSVYHPPHSPLYEHGVGSQDMIILRQDSVVVT